MIYPTGLDRRDDVNIIFDEGKLNWSLIRWMVCVLAINWYYYNHNDEPSCSKLLQYCSNARLRHFFRLIVVFANSKEDVRLQTQIEYLKIDPAALAEREIVVLTDSDPAMDSLLRQKFRPRGFTLLLIGKDGQVKLRKPFPWDLRALSRAIDKMPMRRQEIKAKK